MMTYIKTTEPLTWARLVAHVEDTASLLGVPADTLLAQAVAITGDSPQPVLVEIARTGEGGPWRLIVGHLAS